ncbi:MAG: winged helix-turn-helix domain-containing protein [Rhodospirillaceae bacterium]|jgi:uncharacterized protein|nr:winged helix-turn-helix domain-containing protein [Rhodospirillaceae bacterium]MBT3780853.1 winged helix-turn-helix domain-containing protein [Rhodospirillaceae bacterium]MBT3978946.1 winged helix-turn-helix domain-containing protein [Rhodospirillaceae bacterium]MBT4170875.1 winged helix-turn-helix domain-containing protein [Rhodospirillaceae bacterium]MBT4562834.1 winged helix-turn-helix domain-containing protein [Rhodospirillaceae bacterium]
MSVPRSVIGNQAARRIFMARQGLCHPPHLRQDKDALHRLIQQLGFVQVDSIRTVERAHHMILFARNQTYRPEHLRQLLEEDRRLFEHWTHDAAIIPTAFYPHWRRRFELSEDGLRERWRKWRPKEKSGDQHIGFEDMMDGVRAHITQNGPTMSRDLKRKSPPRTAGKNGWWQWHPSKTALEFLWRTGDLCVSRRDGFQKVYDLSNRVIPEHIHREEAHSKEDFVDWACSAALDRLGFAAPGELAAYWASISAGEAKSWCLENLGEDLIEVLVESADGSAAKSCYARPALIEILGGPADLAAHAAPPDRLRVLSPFDPLIRDRKRLQRLFNFDYRIEIFVPEAEREYGYYVFPLLERDRMIGRIDMKAQRKDNALHITGLWLEPKVKFSQARQKKLAAELKRHARFIGMETVTYDRDYLKSA